MKNYIRTSCFKVIILGLLNCHIQLGYEQRAGR